MTVHVDGPFGRAVSGHETHAVSPPYSVFGGLENKIINPIEGDGVDGVKISGEYSILSREPDHALLGKYGPDATLPRQ